MIPVNLDNSDSDGGNDPVKLDNSDSDGGNDPRAEPRRGRTQERRTRRRPRSKSVMKERSLASAPGEEPFDDLTVELSGRKLKVLPDDLKDK